MPRDTIIFRYSVPTVMYEWDFQLDQTIAEKLIHTALKDARKENLIVDSRSVDLECDGDAFIVIFRGSR